MEGLTYVKAVIYFISAQLFSLEVSSWSDSTCLFLSNRFLVVIRAMFGWWSGVTEKVFAVQRTVCELLKRADSTFFRVRYAAQHE